MEGTGGGGEQEAMACRAGWLLEAATAVLRYLGEKRCRLVLVKVTCWLSVPLPYPRTTKDFAPSTNPCPGCIQAVPAPGLHPHCEALAPGRLLAMRLPCAGPSPALRSGLPIMPSPEEEYSPSIGSAKQQQICWLRSVPPIPATSTVSWST